MVDFQCKSRYDWDDLVEIIRILRAPGGCPWDREQTHRSIRNDFIEETYEVIEAIDKNDPALLREELGDVLLKLMGTVPVVYSSSASGPWRTRRTTSQSLAHPRRRLRRSLADCRGKKTEYIKFPDSEP